MMLATRCTSCGTAFKVVPDQLRVSEGWVRCGRCQAVFNASESLFEVAAARTPEAAAAITTAAGQTSAGDAEIPAWVPPEGRREPPLFPDPVVDALATESQLEPAEISALEAEPAAFSSQRERPPESDEPARSEWMTLDLPGLKPTGEPWGAAEAPMAAGLSGTSTAEHAPSETRATGARRSWTWAWASVAAVLVFGLVSQLGLAFRSELAARWPEARMPLESACSALGCQVEPLHRLADLAIETSGLRALGDTGYYQLSVSVRNRGRTPLQVPAFELTLSDLQGKVVARRVLRPAELGSAAAVIAARGEWPLQIGVSTGSERIHSYAIDIFYP